MSMSILVVDDEADVAELFRQQFRREVRQGVYVMHFAQSGAAALKMLTEGIIPELVVILSDINMPGMDGLTLLGEIKRQWPNQRVMMVMPTVTKIGVARQSSVVPLISLPSRSTFGR